MIQSLAALLQNEAVHEFVATQSWTWPICEMIHFFGMALLVGTVGLLDLRMLGVAKALPVAALERLIPWGIAGFALNLITGYVFIVGSPGGPKDSLANTAFQLKMAFILLAGLNVAAFHFTGVSRRANAVGQGGDAPFAAKIVAASSLFLWLGVIYFGRMIMYSDAFYVREYYGF
jgi:hypothetical protein